MPLYHFYRLVNRVDEVCYIGKTKRALRKRLCEHRSIHSTCSSKQMIETYGRDNVSIVLIHSLEFVTIEEAHREERRLIEEHRGRCVNLVIPYRSVEEKKEQDRVWRETHNEQEKARSKAWHEANKEEMKAQQAVYRQGKREEKNAYVKTWYEANKEAVNARRREARAKAKALISPSTVEKTQ